MAELGAEDRAVKKIAIAFKESRRLWFRDLLLRLDVPDPEGLATQLTLLVDGSIAQDLVRDDPSMARAAKEAARVLLSNAGVEVGEATHRNNLTSKSASGIPDRRFSARLGSRARDRLRSLPRQTGKQNFPIAF